MALSPEIQNEADLARAKITGAENLDDDYKRTLLNIVSVTSTATNGLSMEDKIQNMTEALYMMAIAQVQFVTSVEKTVLKSIDKANVKQCSECRALKHTDEVEEQKKQEELIRRLKLAHGIKDDPDVEEQAADSSIATTWSGFLKKLITQPGMWVFLTILVISPYGVDIIKTLLNFFANK